MKLVLQIVLAQVLFAFVVAPILAVLIQVAIVGLNQAKAVKPKFETKTEQAKR
jgi:hypothetical protein